MYSWLTDKWENREENISRFRVKAERAAGRDCLFARYLSMIKHSTAMAA